MLNSPNNLRFETLTIVKASLTTLYIALVLPIPFLAFNEFRLLSIITFVIGLFLISNITNDYVTTSEESISFDTSNLSNLLGKKSWILFWNDIKQIKSLRTSQGSKVYYFISKDEKKFLVPQRINNYDAFLKTINKRTDIDTRNMSSLAPLWTYKILTLISIIMISLEVFSFLIKGYRY